MCGTVEEPLSRNLGAAACDDQLWLRQEENEQEGTGASETGAAGSGEAEHEEIPIDEKEWVRVPLEEGTMPAEVKEEICEGFKPANEMSDSSSETGSEVHLLPES